MFVVEESFDEPWFVTVGPAPEGEGLPEQIENAQARPGKSFIQVMQELGTPKLPVNPASTQAEVLQTPSGEESLL